VFGFVLREISEIFLNTCQMALFVEWRGGLMGTIGLCCVKKRFYLICISRGFQNAVPHWRKLSGEEV